MNKIDIADVIRHVVAKFGDSAMDDYDTVIAALIRNPKDFNEMRGKLGITRLELLKHCTKLAPDIFKYHLLKFIKENYNFEYDT